jgi:predicted nucleic acid-binding protein
MQSQLSPPRARPEDASDVRRVVVDANVLVSFFIARNAKQSDDAEALLQKAEEGDIAAIIPQFVVFEMTYVLQSQYDVTGDRLVSMIRDVVAFTGVQIVDDCPWRRVLDVWPKPLPDLADGAIVAVATTNRYDAVATFDKKLARRLPDFGLAAYW